MSRGLSAAAQKNLILIASTDDRLARAVAISLCEDRRLLHEKFNKSRTPPWQAMTNHMPPGATQEEIQTSLEDVLDRPDRYMMVMSGYEDTSAWNEAVTTFLQSRPLRVNFIHEEGARPPAALRALCHGYTELNMDSENDPVMQVRIAIMHARQDGRDNQNKVLVTPS